MGDGIRVRLLTNNSHGSAGDVVVISYPIGRELIQAGKAAHVPDVYPQPHAE